MLNQKKIKACLVLLLGAFLFFEGCSKTSVYEPPKVSVPDQWKHLDHKEQLVLSRRWWEIFDDPTLRALEERAIVNSPNLQACIAKVAAVRGVERSLRGERFSQVALSPSYFSSEELLKPTVPGVSVDPFRAHIQKSMFPVAIGYEVDLWGRKRELWKRACYETEGRERAYEASRLSLTAHVAVVYFCLSALEAKISFLLKKQELSIHLISLEKRKKDRGIYDEFGLLALERRGGFISLAIEEVERQRDELKNLLATLIGENPSIFSINIEPLKMKSPPKVPVDLPSTILLRRPDLAEAERKVASSYSSLKVVRANLFPVVRLTSLLGFSSPQLRDFLSWKSRLWTFGTGISWTLFDGGRSRSFVDVARANYNRAEAVYREKILRAFCEVEDSLNNLERSVKKLEISENIFITSKREVLLLQRRVDRGFSSKKETLEGELRCLDAKMALLDCYSENYQYTVGLVRALGGGWSLSPLLLDTSMK